MKAGPGGCEPPMLELHRSATSWHLGGTRHQLEVPDHAESILRQRQCWEEMQGEEQEQGEHVDEPLVPMTYSP